MQEEAVGLKRRNVDTNYNKRTLKLLIIMICCMFFLVVVITIFPKVIKSEWYKINIVENGLNIEDISFNKYENDMAYVNIEVYDLAFQKPRWCIVKDSAEKPSINDEAWQVLQDNKCVLEVNQNGHYIYVRDHNSIGPAYDIENYVSMVLELNVPKTDVKIVVGEKYDIDVTLKVLGNAQELIEYSSQNEQVATVTDGIITGVGDGITKIQIKDSYGHTRDVDVQVTSLLSLPAVNDSKTFLKNKQYTTEQAKILDEYLFYKVDTAGDKTRAGVVAAARFLTLEFQYRVSYFLENGRLAHHNYIFPYADGEGRYYHKGLYLSTDKFQYIEKSVAGLGMWGCYLMEYSTDNGKIRNGLDCSGFVSWCIYNGGFDVGDIGAGPSYGWDTLAECGVSQDITMELLTSGKVKAGDLIGFDGHIGIIIGIDGANVYIADSYYYYKGVCATKFTYSELINSSFTNIYDMSKTYKDDGNYTAMW